MWRRENGQGGGATKQTNAPEGVGEVGPRVGHGLQRVGGRSATAQRFRHGIGMLDAHGRSTFTACTHVMLEVHRTCVCDTPWA